ncbi:hypothetical protein RRG08_043031 [Elysia crispata]|uniref:Uncharacterized protein n=1 Tax=Elysia crispata TaxID=231223 RepID=A0AAE0XZ14_9GAST|nr:hypothetical protein RRG08_043031 [Elysia crispata]
MLELQRTQSRWQSKSNMILLLGLVASRDQKLSGRWISTTPEDSRRGTERGREGTDTYQKANENNASSDVEMSSQHHRDLSHLV